jgi:predicted NBD/HSP70 family sugar kinase
MGVTAPTVSKAVASLLQSRMLEEFDLKEMGRGRPAKRLRLANVTAQVLGLVIDAGQCRLIVAGLDGEPNEQQFSFATPDSYDELLSAVEAAAQPFLQDSNISTLGLGLSMPGLIDYRQQQAILSPNVPVTNGQTPARDLTRRLGIHCVMMQETHALCLAERHYGAAQGLDDFAMLDISTGVGLGVMSSGRVLTGHSGLAGEIGHLPLDDNGRECGCGRRGCLETVASDSALAWLVSQHLDRKVSIEEVVQLCTAGEVDLSAQLDEVCRRLSFALATVISLFNPATLFIYGRLFDCNEGIFTKLVEQTEQRTLGPSFADCHIVQARGSKRQGAVAGIIEYLTDSLVPAMNGSSQSLFANGKNGANHT